MNEHIDYAEMLEIPVSTVNVVRKKSRKKRANADELKDKVVQTVNERVEDGNRTQNFDADEYYMPAERVAKSEDLSEDYSNSEIERETPKRKFLDGKILTAQFIAVLVLAATIFLTNIFWKDSAINTFFTGLLNPSQTIAEDDRVYSQLAMGSIVNDENILCNVSENGVLTFTGECSVYSACDGKIASIEENDGLYTVLIEHTSSFTTRLSNLNSVYFAVGDNVYSTIPVGYSNGENAVSVSMFDNGNLINAYTVNENNYIVWNV